MWPVTSTQDREDIDYLSIVKIFLSWQKAPPHRAAIMEVEFLFLPGTQQGS